MWSQCVCDRSRWTRTGFFSAVICSPSLRIPVPASMTTISLPPITCRHEVLPPYFAVSGPGHAIEPRTPQNLIFMEGGRRIRHGENDCQGNTGTRPRNPAIIQTVRMMAPLRYHPPMRIPATGIILAAAGEGRRLGADVPKAFVPLAGKPLFMHSLETFARLPFVKAVALVLPAAWIERARK